MMVNNYRLFKLGSNPKVPRHIEHLTSVTVGFLVLLALGVIIGLLYFVFTQPFVAGIILAGITSIALFV